MQFKVKSPHLISDFLALVPVFGRRKQRHFGYALPISTKLNGCMDRYFKFLYKRVKYGECDTLQDPV